MRPACLRLIYSGKNFQKHDVPRRGMPFDFNKDLPFEPGYRQMYIQTDNLSLLHESLVSFFHLYFSSLSFLFHSTAFIFFFFFVLFNVLPFLRSKGTPTLSQGFYLQLKKKKNIVTVATFRNY